MEDLWSSDQAVLIKVVELYERNGAHFETRQLLEAYPAAQHDAVRHSLRRLGDHGYIKTLTVGPIMGDSSVQVMAIQGVTEKGLRAIGAYPARDDQQRAQALLAAIDEAADNAPTADERSMLQGARSVVAGLSLNTASALATLLIAKLTGMA
jgi:hypothetical protein